MSSEESFCRYLWRNLTGMSIIGPLVFLLLPRLIFGLSFRSLMPFFAAETVTGVVAIPFLYWGATIGWKKANWKPQLLVVGATLAAVCWITLHYAAKLGVLSPEIAHGSLVAMLIVLPPAIVGGYYMNLKLFPGRFPEHRERERSGENE